MLTADQVRTFWRLGYLPLGRVAEPPVVGQLVAAFNRLADQTCPDAAPEDHLMRAAGPNQHVRVGLHLCHIDDAFRAYAADSSIADLMRALLGDEVVVLTSLLFNKPPRSGQALSLHQDLPYYPYLDDDDLITCWTALDPVGPANGAVEYLAGSHRSRQAHRRTDSQQALDIPEADVDMTTAASVLLAAGEAVAHHGLTVHRSGPNVSEHQRRGLATLYIRASASPSPRDFPYPPIRTDRGGDATWIPQFSASTRSR